MRWLLVVVCAALSCPGFAQTAKENFVNAKTALQDGNAERCLAYLNEAQGQLKGSNVKIEAMRTQAYVMQGDWVNAKISFLNFKAFVRPDSQSEDQLAMNELGEQIEDGLNQMETEFQDKKEEEMKASIDDVDRTIQQEQSERLDQQRSLNSTNSQKINAAAISTGDKELFAFLVTVSDKHAKEFGNLESDWKSALVKNNWEVYDAFLKKYPTSIYTRQAQEKLWTAKENEYQRLLTAGNDNFANKVFRQALDNYERALVLRREALVVKRISECNEEIAWEHTVAARDYSRYQDFMKEYPRSHYYATAASALISSHLFAAESALDKHDWKTVDDQTSTAVARFGNSGSWNGFETRYHETLLKAANGILAEKKNERIDHADLCIKFLSTLQSSGKGYNFQVEINKLNRQKKEMTRSDDDFGFVAYRVSKTTNVGFDFGWNTTRKFGGFISFKLNAKLMKSLNEPFERKDLDYLMSNINLNFSRRVVFPVWIYSGLGMATFQKISTVPNNPQQGIVTETSPKGRGLNIDGGIILNLPPVNLSFGFSAPVFTETAKKKIGLTKSPFMPNVALGINFAF